MRMDNPERGLEGTPNEQALNGVAAEGTTIAASGSGAGGALGAVRGGEPNDAPSNDVDAGADTADRAVSDAEENNQGRAG